MGNFSGKTDNENANQNNNASQGDNKSQSQQQQAAPKKSKGKYKVELCASVLGGSGPFTAYHTSVLIDGRECMSPSIKHNNNYCVQG